MTAKDTLRVTHPIFTTGPLAYLLCQGNGDDALRACRLGGFEVVVFAAVEWQPTPPEPSGEWQPTLILRCPLRDNENEPMTEDEQRAAVATAREVARHLRQGKRVLSSCVVGRNRSGLISALALVELGCLFQAEAIDMVRAAVGERALGNRRFVEFILQHEPELTYTWPELFDGSE